MNIKLSFLVIGLLCSALNARAEEYFVTPSRTIEYSTGIIDAIHPNTIDVVDERDHALRRFVYMFGTGGFEKGERVRVYYQVGSNIAQSIKKMTPVEYNQDGQNAGFLFKAEH